MVSHTDIILHKYIYNAILVLKKIIFTKVSCKFILSVCWIFFLKGNERKGRGDVYVTNRESGGTKFSV